MMKLNLPKEFYCDVVDSTNAEAKRLIQRGEIKTTSFVVANHQTAGKGTKGRSWVSPKGSGIYLSIVHLPKKNSLFKITTMYTQASGVATVEAIKKVTGLETKIKPINDIYANERKLGGILTESVLKEEGMLCLITGIGINTHKVERNLNVPSISLEEMLVEEDFKKFSKEKLIEEIVSNVCHWYEFIFKGESKKVEDTFNSYSL